MTESIIFGLLGPLFSILVTWIPLFLMFTGCGLLVRAACRRDLDKTFDVFQSFWLGWAGTVAFLQIYQIWLF